MKTTVTSELAQGGIAIASWEADGGKVVLDASQFITSPRGVKEVMRGATSGMRGAMRRATIGVGKSKGGWVGAEELKYSETLQRHRASMQIYAGPQVGNHGGVPSTPARHQT